LNKKLEVKVKVEESGCTWTGETALEIASRDWGKPRRMSGMTTGFRAQVWIRTSRIRVEIRVLIIGTQYSRTL